MEPVTINGLPARFRGLGLFAMPAEGVGAEVALAVTIAWVPGTFVRASSALWMKWHLGPYGQNPMVWKVRHNSVLYLGWRTRFLNSWAP